MTRRALLGARVAVVVLVASVSTTASAAPPKAGRGVPAKAAPAKKDKKTDKKAEKKTGKKDKKTEKRGAEGELSPEEANRALAAAKKKEGDDAMQEQRYGDALAAYDAAYAVSPEPALLYNRARAEEHSEHYPEALALFEEFIAKAPAELRAKVPKLDELVAGIRNRVAIVDLRANVDGAAIKVRGASLGQTPLKAPVRLATGPATIEITLEGYKPFSRELTLPGGTPTVVDAQLQRNVKPTVLVVRSTVAGAVVSVDGEIVGGPPVERTMQPGPHEIVASRSGHKSTRMRITMEEGTRRELQLDPTPESSLTSRWWFWTGIGVGVAGGVALTAALLTEKNPGKGTIAPGQVTAGLVRF